MRKSIIPATAGHSTLPDGLWMDVGRIASLEVSSEDPDHPIEDAFLDGEQDGWQASATGEQSIRLIFDVPQQIGRIQLRFDERVRTRCQEFALKYSGGGSEGLREIVRQQWTFSPTGSTLEIENYQISLSAVTVLELTIDPDRGAGEARATLTSWRLAAS